MSSSFIENDLNHASGKPKVAIVLRDVLDYFPWKLIYMKNNFWTLSKTRDV